MKIQILGYAVVLTIKYIMLCNIEADAQDRGRWRNFFEEANVHPGL